MGMLDMAKYSTRIAHYCDRSSNKNQHMTLSWAYDLSYDL